MLILMLILLLSCLGVLAFVVLLGWVGHRLCERGRTRAGIALLNAAISLAPILTPVAMATFFLLIFWSLEALGVWEPPTPENIRKLDLKMHRDTQLTEGTD